MRKAWFGLSFFWCCAALAETNQPYIDQLKATLPEDSAPQEDGSFTEAVRKKLKIQDEQNPPETTGSFIQNLRDTDPSRDQPVENYLDNQRTRIRENDASREVRPSVIESVQAGTATELKMDRPPGVSKAFGFRMGAWMNAAITATNELNSFGSIFPGSWAPDIQLTGEFQILQHDYIVALGIQGQLGGSVWKGTGVFADPTIEWPTDSSLAGSQLGATSRTSLSFVSMPMSIGPILRLNVLRVLRPYVFVGGLLIPFWELRSDSVAAKRGFSFGMNLEGGIAIQMDAFDKKAAFEMWDAYSVKHVYLTASYQMILSFGSPVSFNNSGIYAGIMAEF